MKKWLWIGGISLVVIGSATYFLWPESTDAETLRVSETSLKRTITVSGSVKSPTEINLAFKGSGRISDVGVVAGDTVEEGAYLASLDTAEAENAIQQAQASLNEASARFAQFQAGITDEERKLLIERRDNAQKNLDAVQKSAVSEKASAESAYQAAKVAFENAQKNFDDGQLIYNQVGDQTNISAQLTARSAVSNIESTLEQVDLLMGYTDKYRHNNDAFENSLSALNLSFKQEAQNLFNSLQSKLAQLGSDSSDTGYMQSVVPLLDTALNLTDAVIQVLNNTVASADLTQSSLNTYQNNFIALKSSLFAGKLSVETSLQQIQNFQISGSTSATGLQSTLSQLQNALSLAQVNLSKALADVDLIASQSQQRTIQAENELRIAERDLEQRVARPRELDLNIYRSAIQQAQARLNQAKIQRDNLVLYAPVESVIGKMHFEKGETVSGGQTVFSLLAGKPNEVEVHFPETDIVYIHPGKELTFTFDGFSQEYVYEGKVDSIEPAPTEIQGVIYYVSDISFDPQQYPEVQPRSGMTVNIDVIADQRDDVLGLPYSAIREDNFGIRFVARLKDGSREQYELVEITTGFEGDENIEIISGLKKGDTVLREISKFEQ